MILAFGIPFFWAFKINDIGGQYYLRFPAYKKKLGFKVNAGLPNSLAGLKAAIGPKVAFGLL